MQPILIKIDSFSARNLEALLADLTMKIRSSKSPNEIYSNIESDVAKINKLMIGISNVTVGQALLKDKGFRLQASLVLLEAAIQNYKLLTTSSIQNEESSTNRENTLGLVNSSMINFESVSDFVSYSRGEEIRSFYHQIQESINLGLPFDTCKYIITEVLC